MEVDPQRRRKRRPRARPVRSRTVGVVVLLSATLVLVAVLASQALSAAASHRAAVQEAMRGYSALAGWEYMRRVEGTVSYPFYEATRLVGRVTQPLPATGLPEPADLVVDVNNNNARRGRGLMAFLFCVDHDGLTVAGRAPAASIHDWMAGDLLAAVTAAPSRGGVYRYVPVHVGDDAQILVCREPQDTPVTRVCGFGLHRENLGALLEDVYEQAPLLPPALGFGEVEREWVHVSIYDDAGKALYESPGSFEPNLGAYHALGNEIPGLVVRPSVQPEAVALLAAGGMPPSRLPVLLALLALTVGLLALAIRQLRRQQELDRLRSDFISSVSHELRTPLTQIRMFTEMLRLGRVRTPEERDRSLEIVDQESRRLTHLVENILQFSRAERGALRLAPEPVDLAQRVVSTVDAFTPLARTSGATLHVETPAEVTAQVDPDAFSQVLLNFLDNAVRYGPRNQQIHVGLTPHEHSVEVWVDDEGPGVAPENRERIWRRFERLAGSVRAAAAGAGIGLAVVRELVEMHEGSVRVVEGERGGARFIASFPRAAEV